LIFKAYQESGRPHLPGRGKLRAASITDTQYTSRCFGQGWLISGRGQGRFKMDTYDCQQSDCAKDLEFHFLDIGNSPNDPDFRKWNRLSPPNLLPDLTHDLHSLIRIA